ncbi:MAG: hypothetical protein A2X36_01865 [Elusimicrobia bacterium GWA2_69_24]|nr:MAG: hypothetical protein A2X36_01865 [Elusimicrobia bacterium GWA2_69_24]HBL16890.1 hypothetical protein [Elusimicrobiota bacterium]
MKYGLLLLAVLVAPVRAELPAFDFDQMNLDVPAVVADAKEAAAADKDSAQVAPLYWHATRDCVTFSFDPEGPTLSEAVWLQSTEYRQECHWVGGTPQQGGHQQCYEVPSWTYRERVQVQVQDREKLFPWEREIFDVCLEGRWLNAYAVRAAHKYTLRQNGDVLIFAAGTRVPMDPDKNGIRAQAPVNRGKEFAAEFQDKWAAEYKGEQTVLHAALWEDVEGWFDNNVFEGDFTFSAAEKYAIDFAKAAPGKLKAGKKYYVKWSFKRVGKISKPTEMKVGETPGTVYAPNGLILTSL